MFFVSGTSFNHVLS